MKTNWKDGRVVLEPELLENRERPRLGFFHHRERWRAKANRPRLHAALLDSLQRFLQVLFELLRRDFSQQQVVVTMNCDLVAAGFNLANQIRQPFGNPAQHEERGARLMLSEERQQTLGAFANTQLTAIPIAQLDHAREVMHAKPVFKINRDRVLHTLAARSRTGSHLM